MVIHIALIGENTGHVKTWLKEESRPIEKLWLIHSKKGRHDFPKIAKSLEKDLLRSYDNLTIEKKIVEDAWTMDPTMDAILKIIKEEEKKDVSLIPQDFAINITGGTNVMGAAALLSATKHGTKAYYVKDSRIKIPGVKKYVDELPVPSIGVAKYNELQLKVLQIIEKSYYEVENTPEGYDARRIDESITRTNLLEKLSKAKFEQFKVKPGKKIRLEYTTEKLVDDGLINKFPFTEKYIDLNSDNKTKMVVEEEHLVRVKNKDYKPNWKIFKNEKEIRYEITPAGKRQSRDAFMF